MSAEPAGVSLCWDCGAPSAWRRIAVEAVIHARTKAEGGPYRTFQCPACRIEVGALRGPDGMSWLLHPLRGLAEPGLLDRLLPAGERRALERAHRWWRANAIHLERFRRGMPDPEWAAVGAPPGPDREPADRRGGAAPEAEAARGGTAERARRRAPPPSPGDRKRSAEPRASDPRRATLGVSAEAGIAEIRRAYRTLAKRWHPDRVGGDATAQRDATRRFREVRAAYEALVRELA